jgi:prepilin-type N-terminal cleavage/methylation domain-containing protein/prepilin-type processing-associated H-X9-DG protein
MASHARSQWEDADRFPRSEQADYLGGGPKAWRARTNARSDRANQESNPESFPGAVEVPAHALIIRTMRPTRVVSRRRIRPRFAGSFTLIEMLVVVAIISLLISILTPSLSRARQQAKSTVCLARLSEFMKGLTAYIGDHSFQLPPMSYKAIDSEDSKLHGWAECLYEYLYQDRDFALDEDYPVQRNRKGRYELWVCKEGVPLADSSGHYRVYELSWLKGSLDMVKARIPLIMDANPVVTDPNDLRLSCIPKEHIAGLEGEAYIDERHYGGANYAFNDAHAERSTSLKEQLAQDWDLDPNTPNE